MLYACNSPVQRYMCEMTGDMPCRREVFAAGSPQAFVEAAALEPVGPPPMSLADSVTMLLEDSWPGPNSDAFKRLTPETLHLLISGEQKMPLSFYRLPRCNDLT